MATILILPKNEKAYEDFVRLAPKIAENARRASEQKTHFLLSLTPDDYEVYASLGEIETVEPDEETGLIRINLTKFPFMGAGDAGQR